MNNTLDIKPLLKERYAGNSPKPVIKRFKKLKEYIRSKPDVPTPRK